MKSKPLVIAFSDCSYLPLLQLWLQRLGQLGVDRVKVFCLDAVTSDWCASQRVAAAQIHWSGDLRDLWVQRIAVFSDLLARGEGFIHSDIDAIWVRNPLEAGSAPHSAEDLIFSQGTVWPPDVHDRWGFVLCCGWFWAKATAAARSFFQALEADVRRTGDDQISVNRLLIKLGLGWNCRPPGEYQLSFHDRVVQCWSRPVRAASGTTPLSVALLPHREFQRLPENSDHAVVKHYLTPKNCLQKLSILRTYGLI